MTDSDQKWMQSEFDGIKELFKTHKENTDRRLEGVEVWVNRVECKTDNNSKYINLIVGGLILVGAIVGIFEIALNFK